MSDDNPARWLADPTGRFEQRFWDGTKWTEHVARADRTFTDALVEQSAAPPFTPGAAGAPRSGTNGFAAFLSATWRGFRRWPTWAQIVTAVVVVATIIGAVASGGSSDKKSAASKSTKSQSQATAAPRTTSPTIPPTTRTTTPPTTTTPPQPSVYDGTGDDVIKVTRPTSAAIFFADYHAGSNFVVWSLDATNQHIDLLVNTIGQYTGSAPLDFQSGQSTVSLEINASGPWHIELRPLNAARRFDASIQGSGDEVVVYTGKAGVAAIANQGPSNFVVHSYTTTASLLVNEIGNYSGRVPISAGTNVVAVKSSGDWTIAVT